MIWVHLLIEKIYAFPAISLGVTSLLILVLVWLVSLKLAEIFDFNEKKQRAIEELIQRYEHIHSHT